MIMNVLLSNYKYFGSILIFLMLINSGFSIKCWVCHSDADPKCADPFDNSTLPIKDCSEVQTHLVEDEGDYERLKQQWDSKLYPMSSRPTPKPKRATMCRKTRQKIFGTWRTIRSCAFEGSPGEGTGNEHHCLIRRGTHDIYQEFCTCNSKDGCNSASLLNVNIFIVILSLGISKLL